jgi:hypothetical protein
VFWKAYRFALGQQGFLFTEYLKDSLKERLKPHMEL